MLAACHSFFKRGLSDSVVAKGKKKNHAVFGMADFWAVLPAQTLTLSGGLAMEHLIEVCEQRDTI